MDKIEKTYKTNSEEKFTEISKNLKVKHAVVYDEKYRYKCLLKWGNGENYPVFIMLNPPETDREDIEKIKTIGNCISILKYNKEYYKKYDGIIILNLFAACADNEGILFECFLKKNKYPKIIEDKNKAIIESVLNSEKIKEDALIVIAWGDGRFSGKQQKNAKKMLESQIMHVNETLKSLKGSNEFKGSIEF